MNYEKKYKESLELARDYYKANLKLDKSDENLILEDIFPELKESEDERIRQEIITFIKKRDKSWCDYDYNLWLAWLEKQGEQKSFDYENANIQQKDFAPKVEPKFKVGDLIRLKDGDGLEWTIKEMHHDGYYTIVCEDRDDFIYLDDRWELVGKLVDKIEAKFHEGEWVVDSQGLTHQIERVVENVTTHTFGYDIVGGGYFNNDNESVHLWTIQDAKDGDVLASNRSIFIFSQEYIAGKPEAHCGIMNGLFIAKSEGCWTNEECYPATKEQRDILFAKMKEAGYEWDAEKKELKKISQRMVSAEAKEALYDKPAWSEEDECYMSECIGAIATKDGWSFEEKRKTKHWLKSLKQRIGG